MQTTLKIDVKLRMAALQGHARWVRFVVSKS
jgi:hypothetical protein